jgi:hypothetical protein
VRHRDPEVDEQLGEDEGSEDRHERRGLDDPAEPASAEWAPTGDAGKGDGQEQHP